MDPIALAGLGLAFISCSSSCIVPIAAAMALTGFVFFGIMNGIPVGGQPVWHRKRRPPSPMPTSLSFRCSC